jgi:hypothetical protein
MVFQNESFPFGVFVSNLEADPDGSALFSHDPLFRHACWIGALDHDLAARVSIFSKHFHCAALV